MRILNKRGWTRLTKRERVVNENDEEYLELKKRCKVHELETKQARKETREANTVIKEMEETIKE